MSDWIDLQLAHSMGPVKAPDDLWARIDAASALPRRSNVSRWVIAAACAAGVMALFARPIYEARDVRPEFASSDPAAIQRWLAHEAGVEVRLRPAPGVCIKSARVVKKGVAAVSYEADGAPATAIIARGGGESLCRIPGHTVSVASAKMDAACRLCHTL
jgi:hypothetical protein